jgi:NADH-quinone oxidoreductase subunit C
VDLQQRSLEIVKDRYTSEVVGEGVHAGQHWIEVKREKVVAILRTLKEDGPFEMLMDLTAVDHLNQGRPERFCVVYQLRSLTHGGYFRVKAWVPEDDPQIDTACGVWPAANWAEREVWDFFGLRFAGHPDLKRIQLPETYTGHPLRKDYPTTGRGERYEFPNHRRPGTPAPPRRP